VVLAFLLVTSLPKQIWLWCRPSIMLSARAIENIFIRTRGEDSFLESWLLFLQSPL
jgi:hypothetical protein